MRRLSTTTFEVLVVVLLLQALPGIAWAQSGKLSGRVTEVDTGEPIPGATVVLQGTNQGTATDPEGRYFLIGLDPGTYAVRVSFVGYTPVVVEDVRVTSDRTTTLNVQLSTGVVEADEVVVEATRPVVDANQTTSRSLVTGEEIQRLPVTDLQDVISRTANSYEGFVRGSRRFETKTIVEGIDVSDAYYALSQGSSYGGSTYNSTNRTDETNPSIFTLNPEGVEEVTVNSGAAPARYSSASGGVVTVSLAELRGPITGSVSARYAPQINVPGPDSLEFYGDGQAYLDELAQLQEAAAGGDEAAADKAALYTWTPDKYAYADDPEVDIRATLGGSITDRWSFFLAGQWFQTNGYLPNYFRKRISGQLKTSFDLSSSTRVSLVGLYEDRGLWGNWNNRDYQEFWRFYLEGVAQNDGGSYLGSIKLTQILSEQSFLDVQLYRTYSRNRYGYPDDNGNGYTELGEDGDFIDFADPAAIDQYIGIASERSPMFYERISDPFSDSGVFLPDGRRYKLANPVVYGEDARLATNGVKVDYSNQITFNHFIQTGVEVKLRDFDYQEFYGVDGLGFTLNAEDEPYIPRSYQRKPWEFSVYASDRMEYGGLIVNLGARLDFVNRDTERIVDHFYPFVRDTINVAGRPLARNFFNRGEDVGVDVFFNPSIGVSHPIGSRAAMYFSYARSQQLVPYNTLYSNYDGNHSTSRFFTYQDPAQDKITSNNYELGVQWEFAEGWGVDVNAYMRSIDNYGSAGFNATNRTPEGAPSLTGLTIHTYRTSFGYADVRGVELVLRRQPLALAQDFRLGVTASYTFSSVERAYLTGDNQSDFRDIDVEDNQIPFDNANDFQNFPQNVRGGNSIIEAGFDRTHRGVLRAVAALPLDFSLGLSSTIESGFLYPRAIGGDQRDRELLTGPTNYQIDLRLEKRFNLSARSGFDLYFDVTNLTNRNNVIAYDTNDFSGPARFQETGVPGSRLILNDGSPIYGPARNIYFGGRVRF
jgi:outer membrane receptor protein involved in Fe transport